jgi:hypothetical protein
MKLDGTQNWSGRFGKAKYLMPLPEIKHRFFNRAAVA